MALWKFHCMETEWPGLWQRWFLNQCVAVGWPPEDKWPLDGEIGHEDTYGWNRARNALKRIKIGDDVIVTLSHHRIGRIGRVIKLEINDGEWDPLVPSSKDYPSGEMGRRILVRWDLAVGPTDRDLVTLLPESGRFNSGELRPTVCEIRSTSVTRIRAMMQDETNWVGLWSHFDYESALSDYIATYPHRLEDGLLPYPNEKVRERVFKGGRRLDVLLIDRDKTPVIVECKQHQPTAADILQLRDYMESLRQETNQKPRGILVHGGARNLHQTVKKIAQKEPKIEIVQYKLDVDFSNCN